MKGPKVLGAISVNSSINSNLKPKHLSRNFLRMLMKLYRQVSKVGDRQAPSSIATTPRYREGHYPFPYIAPLYPWYVPYIAEC